MPSFPYLHAARLDLVHLDLDVDLAGVRHVLLRLDVDVLKQAARVDVVHRIIAVVNVVVLPLLQGPGRQGIQYEYR